MQLLTTIFAAELTIAVICGYFLCQWTLKYMREINELKHTVNDMLKSLGMLTNAQNLQNQNIANLMGFQDMQAVSVDRLTTRIGQIERGIDKAGFVVCADVTNAQNKLEAGKYTKPTLVKSET